MKLKEVIDKLDIKVKLPSKLLDVDLEENIDNFTDYKNKDGLLIITGKENINTDIDDDVEIIRNINITINPNDEDEILMLESYVEDNFQQYIVYNNQGGIERIG